MKREVAAERQVFRGANVKLGNWRQVTVQFIICENTEMTVVKLRVCVSKCATHTEMCTVTTCCTEIRDNNVSDFKVRKGGGFFYGKSSNENYT